MDKPAALLNFGFFKDCLKYEMFLYFFILLIFTSIIMLDCLYPDGIGARKSTINFVLFKANFFVDHPCSGVIRN